MDKNYILTLYTLFIFCFSSFGQEKLLNGNFESWDDNSSPTSWTKKENITKESTDVHGGSFAAKQVGGTKDIGQTIDGIVAGKSYTISIWYKVVIEKDGTDARIWSYWKDASNGNIDNNDNDTEDAIRGPNNSYLPNNGNVWTEYTVTITAPANATKFYFELRTYSGATVLWDDLSFVENAAASVKNQSIDGFATYPNPISNQEFTISTTSNDTKKVSLYNILGREVVSQTYTGNRKKIQLNDMSSGIYILKVTENDKIATKKVVIK